ncbi:cobalamin biosynthesis protein CobW [Aestuariirhabdus litorea]|uniref:Cobalamin biosynthesis protein CobW n=1 Tax=Aestuariirhabdus litorea TaxID=2528527 RepID=A0A3P3VUT8_9GAMM|nr:cobalamin biosynthesis protein CobW [Aestuariirhabdus litorea]RRJ84513.1 cobalamin biosynthesis protein CobW [Aestuariirhabdus litorea]RWW97738.1 cobalamin biosynthesis protein CobW [Endozoicomonadaceae bacterium GTF-13]
MNLNKIPATIVTGFLGSGKTTLLSNILRQANGKRIAVIVNEFGALDIDAELLRSCPLECDEQTPDSAAQGSPIADNGIYELANGCICCTVEEEFLPVMEALVERRDQIDHILIETSGLALPKPLVQAFNWPQIKLHCTVDAVITVVDGPALVDGRIAHDPEQVQAQRQADTSLDHDPSLQELLDDQLSSADLVLISKQDLMDEAQLIRLQEQLAGRIGDAVRIHPIRNGEVEQALILGLESASEEHIDHRHTHHDHHHAEGAEHHHAHDHFDSISLDLGELDSDALLAALKVLVAEQAIYRVKGFVALAGKPMRQVVQGVGERFERYFDRPWAPGEPRSSRIVVIGKGLDPQQIEARLQATGA